MRPLNYDDPPEGETKLDLNTMPVGGGQHVKGADGVMRRATFGAFGFQMIEGDGPEHLVTDDAGQRVVVTGADGVDRVVKVVRGR